MQRQKVHTLLCLVSAIILPGCSNGSDTIAGSEVMVPSTLRRDHGNLPPASTFPSITRLGPSKATATGKRNGITLPHYRPVPESWEAFLEL